MNADNNDFTIKKIKNILDKYDYPITTMFISKQIGQSKQFVNKILYNNKQFVKLECMPPLWKWNLSSPTPAQQEKNYYYAILIADCQNCNTDRHKCLSAHFCFESEALFEQYEADQYDKLIDEFDKWLQENSYKNWNVDDVIETDNCGSKYFAKMVNPRLILN